MKRLSATTIAVMLSASAAYADDRPSIWTGAYIGAHVGQTWGTTSMGCGKACGAPGKVSVSGQTYGATLGYNWQVSDRIVLGVEGDVSFSDVEGDRFFGGKVFAGMSMHSEMQSLHGNVRGRAGFLVTPTLMMYATGGVATADWRNRFNGGGWAGTHDWAGSFTGWTVGGGVEMFVAKDLTIKGEYLYTDYGSETSRFGTSVIVHEPNTQTVRVGLNYKFW